MGHTIEVTCTPHIQRMHITQHVRRIGLVSGTAPGAAAGLQEVVVGLVLVGSVQAGRVEHPRTRARVQTLGRRHSQLHLGPCRGAMHHARSRSNPPTCLGSSNPGSSRTSSSHSQSDRYLISQPSATRPSLLHGGSRTRHIGRRRQCMTSCNHQCPSWSSNSSSTISINSSNINSSGSSHSHSQHSWIGGRTEPAWWRLIMRGF
jgi:hypothetical protein